MTWFNRDMIKILILNDHSIVNMNNIEIILNNDTCKTQWNCALAMGGGWKEERERT